MSTIEEDAARMGELPRAPQPTGYATLTVDGIRLWALVHGGCNAGVFWETEKNRGEVHLHLDADPQLKRFILLIRSTFASGSEQAHIFDEMAATCGLEPWTWEVDGEARAMLGVADHA